MIPFPATATPSATPTLVKPTPMSDVRFWTDPTQVVAGKCATVLWQTDNVQEVYFDGEAVTGEGARAFCPCVAETHVLRVRFRDGRWQDYTVTIGVTGTCAAGASPLATPTFSPSPEPTTALPSSRPDPPTAAPQPTLLARPTHSEATSSVVSPLVSPTPDAVPTGGLADAMLSPLPSPTPVVPVTRATVVTLGGAVMAEIPPGVLASCGWVLQSPCCLAQALLPVDCGSGSAVGSHARCQRRARTSPPDGLFGATR